MSRVLRVSEESCFIKTLECVYDFISLDTLSTQKSEFYYFRVDIRGELLPSSRLLSEALKNQEI